MKDPAFLFYYQDFLVGTDEMTNEEVGAYIRCLCHQAHKGYISDKHMKNICYSSDIHNAIKSKFISENNDDNFINERLKFEIERRKKYTESRSNNRKGKVKEVKDISKTYDKHMENENEIENEIKIKDKKEIKLPTIIEVKEYFKENGYKEESAVKFFGYYSVANWKDSKGNEVKSWKQKAQAVWFKDENKIVQQPEKPIPIKEYNYTICGQPLTKRTEAQYQRDMRDYPGKVILFT